MPITSPSSSLARGPLIYRIVKLLYLLFAQLPLIQALPLHLQTTFDSQDEPEGKPPNDPSLWLYLGVAAALVLLGGAFAGLTIALMGQDEIYLQVIKTSGEGAEKKHAAKVLRLLSKGKHWVLVTLLLSNVITNETLPIVLDRSLGGGWPAVLGSTVLIVIFGEIVPQSVCVRFGLPIGAWMSPFVLILMYIMAPVAWPTAKLLDYLLGQDHGTVYKKAGLKTLVTLHKTLGVAGEQLNSDEVTIISACLDLKEKPVADIMTPMEDVFTMHYDTVLDERTMDMILSQGYSRIPIHAPNNRENFVGMLLVKMLITYDPEDCKRVRDFSLATLPETRGDTSCLDIINFFQEGKSHMVLVSTDPGSDHGALGVVTLEDVIEELIGEEIIDESDVFIDVGRAIRRITPAPKARVPRGKIVTDLESSEATTSDAIGTLIDITENETISPAQLQLERSRTATAEFSSASPKVPQAFFVRRRSSTAGSDKAEVLKRANTLEIRQHLKHLGPANAAAKPKATRNKSIHMKPGRSLSQGGEDASTSSPRRVSEPHNYSPISRTGGKDQNAEAIVGSGGKFAKDGAQLLQSVYGGVDRSPSKSSTSNKAVKAGQERDLPDPGPNRSHANGSKAQRESPSPGAGFAAASDQQRPSSQHSSSSSHSSVRSIRELGAHRGPARSGSITEHVVDHGGIRKIVLEATSSSSSEDLRKEAQNSGMKGTNEAHDDQHDGQYDSQARSGGTRKKRRRKKNRSKVHYRGQSSEVNTADETQPLL